MTDPDPIAIPLVAEQASVGVRAVETGKVTVRTLVDERIEHARADLTREAVGVTRVPIGREVDAVPPVREDGDLVVIPVVEEILVIEKRLVLREEIHLRRTRQIERVEQPVTVRTMRAVVERTDPDEPQPDPKED